MFYFADIKLFAFYSTTVGKKLYSILFNFTGKKIVNHCITARHLRPAALRSIASLIYYYNIIFSNISLQTVGRYTY